MPDPANAFGSRIGVDGLGFRARGLDVRFFPKGIVLGHGGMFFFCKGDRGDELHQDFCAICTELSTPNQNVVPNIL